MIKSIDRSSPSRSRTIAVAIAELRGRGYLWTLPHKGSYTRPPEHWPEGR
jgi:hypothetical protein